MFFSWRAYFGERFFGGGGASGGISLGLYTFVFQQNGRVTLNIVKGFRQWHYCCGKT